MNGSVKQRIRRGIPMDYIIHYDVAAFVITLAITLHFCYKKSIVFSGKTRDVRT